MIKLNARLKGIWSSSTQTTTTNSLRQAKVYTLCIKSKFCNIKAISRHPDSPRRANDPAGGRGFREFVQLLRHLGDENLGREGQGRLHHGDQQCQVQEPDQEGSGGEGSVKRCSNLSNKSHKYNCHIYVAGAFIYFVCSLLRTGVHRTGLWFLPIFAAVNSTWRGNRKLHLA